MQSQIGNAAFSRAVTQRRVDRLVAVQRDEFPGLGSVAAPLEGEAAPSSSDDAATIVGLRRQDGLDWGTWEKRPRVQRLQALLNDKQQAGLGVDGMWGPKTSAALHAFQASRGLPASEIVDPVTAQQLAGPAAPVEEPEGVIHPEGETEGDPPDSTDGKEKPKARGDRQLATLLNIERAVDRHAADSPELEFPQSHAVQRDAAAPLTNFGPRWKFKAQCVMNEIRAFFDRTAEAVRGLVGQAISTGGAMLKAAITAFGTAIAGPIGGILGAIAGWFAVDEIEKRVRKAANRAIDKIFNFVRRQADRLLAGLAKLAEPVIRTWEAFKRSWRKVVSWADPWLKTVHDSVKWVRDTLLLVNIQSDKLGSIVTTIADIRAFGEETTAGCKRN